MPAKDLYHDTVKTALIKDGWVITDDPLKFQVGKRSIYIDLGAKKLLGAEKYGRKIAVEIKSFTAPSPVSELEKALGQYELYSLILEDEDPQRILFLAVNDYIFETFFAEEIGQKILKKKNLRVIVFNPTTQEIIKWIK